MTKKEALQYIFNRSPMLVQLLILHRDGLCHAEKATLRDCEQQTVWNQASLVLKYFGVATMVEAVRHAIHYEIIEPCDLPEAPVSEAWSEELQNYHRKYIEGLSRAEKREMGIEDLN